MKNTILELRYTDASNYKANETVVLEGAITQAQLDSLIPHLIDGEMLIAEEVGLPTPSEQFEGRFDFPTADDHVYTTLMAFAEGEAHAEAMHTDNDHDGLMTVAEFVHRVKVAKHNVMAEMTRLDIPA